MSNDECYFTFIKSFNFLNKCIHEKNYNLINNEILKSFIIFNFYPFEKELLCTMILKEFHLLYLYFSNYPYLYEILTDEEINKIFAEFKPSMDKNQVHMKLASSFYSLSNTVALFAMKLEKDKSILEDKKLLKDFQMLLIEFICSFEQLYRKIDIEKFSKYYQIKNYFRDMDFCLCKFIQYTLSLCKTYPFISEINHYINNEEKRCRNYIFYYLHLIKDNITPENEQEKIFNQAIRYNDIIVIEDKNFLDIISKMNLPCKNKYLLNEKEVSNFFKKPRKINNKYNICKYLIIMNEKNRIEYLETFKYIANEYALKIVLILYIQNRNFKIDKIIFQTSFIPIILTYCEKDILN